ncbi:Gpi1 [Drosophila busckii]|uniref:Gpi1 n=1 Tax=Drosophila busckii TaxID=30019 RepID=A0A0M4F8Z3_DROBS|nr:uncharacterized protein LOC108607233 isoform X2 [Drosophila busckii]ALC48582.1 Gpi1 [Drosophila busckii]
MSIKIYLPTDLFYTQQSCNLYGELNIGDENVVVYYVLDTSVSEKDTLMPHRYLGSILCSDLFENSHYCRQQDMILCFTYSQDSPHISLKFTSITPEILSHVKLILYDKQIMSSLMLEPDRDSCLDRESSSLYEEECDFQQLAQLLQPILTQKTGTSFGLTVSRALYTFTHIPMVLFKQIVSLKFVNSILRHTVVYKHYQEWEHMHAKRLTNIVLDRALGIILMLTLFLFVAHPGDFLIQLSHMVINELYTLLRVLEGSPIGLKLNIHLNNFFLDCFKYHIELWSTFLDLIEPAVRQIFLAIAAFGCLGLSFQIALLADLISIVSLHAHCFYVYTKVLKTVEVKGLKVLWQVVRGNRYNILRHRIETHNYKNRQLYLATIFFSAILFLFPTTLVYYIVFASLKGLTYVTLKILEFFRRKLLNMPIAMALKHMRKGFYEIDCLRILDIPLSKQLYLTHRNAKILIYVYKIQI